MSENDFSWWSSGDDKPLESSGSLEEKKMTEHSSVAGENAGSNEDCSAEERTVSPPASNTDYGSFSSENHSPAPPIGNTPGAAPYGKSASARQNPPPINPYNTAAYGAYTKPNYPASPYQPPQGYRPPPYTNSYTGGYSPPNPYQQGQIIHQPNVNSRYGTPPAGFNPANRGYAPPSYPVMPNQPQPTESVPPEQNIGSPKRPKKKRTGLAVFVIFMVLVLTASGIGLIFAMSPQKDGRSSVSPSASNSFSVSGSEKETPDDKSGISIASTPSVTPSIPSGTILTAAQVYQKLQKSNVGIVVSDGDLILGEGSGIIMSSDGKIITCAHVISDYAEEAASSRVSIKVILYDNTSFDAVIMGYDNRSDLAVVKIDPKDTKLSPAEFGNSEALQVGETVFAIGNPGGMQFAGSITQGIVSSIDRPVGNGFTMKNIQHSAQISPGNSGGMLCNSYGQVVGANSSKIASEAFEGMGFAIPLSSSQKIIDDLIKYKYVTGRTKLGIYYNKITADYQYSLIANRYKLPQGSLVIEKIAADSDLKNYDVKAGDFITAVNGVDLKTGNELTQKMEESSPGGSITLTICRISNNQANTREITCKLVEDKGN